MSSQPAATLPPFDTCDALLIDQRLFALATEPLANYFALAESTSPFAGSATGRSRGYQATWEIRDGRLYLTAIQGTLAGGRAGSLGDLFPDFGRRVFAHWFSGRLEASCPRPAIGKIVLTGIIANQADIGLVLDIEQGIVLQPAAAVAAALPPRVAETIA